PTGRVAPGASAAASSASRSSRRRRRPPTNASASACARRMAAPWSTITGSMSRPYRRGMTGMSLALRRGTRSFVAAEGGVGGGEAGDGHAVGRARHVVEPDLVEELHRGWITAVLAADAELEVGPRLAAVLDGLAH